MSELADKLLLRTKNLSLRVIRMIDALPRSTAGFVLGKQVLRSATSIGANYREAYRARSPAEFIAKLGDCLREAEETGYWLELLAESELMAASKLTELQRETRELVA